MQVLEVAQNPWQSFYRGSRGMTDADSAFAASCRLPRKDQGVIKTLQYCPCLSQEEFSWSCQCQSSRTSLEESYTGLGLQIANLTAEWWLRDMKPLSCAADTFLLRHSDEVPQVP
jgi:hypothetical protein